MSRTAEASPHPSRPTGRRAAVAVLGGLAACVPLLVLLLALLTADASQLTGTLLWAGLVLPTAGWLWVSRNWSLRWFALGMSVGFLLGLVVTLAPPPRSQPQKDIPGRLARAAAADEPPSYFLGRSYQGIDLTYVEDDGTYFAYGTCVFEDDSGCSPPIQVQNGPEHMSSAAVGCSRLRDIRGVPAVSLGGGVWLFTSHSAITIFADGTGTLSDLRAMAEAVRPVSGPADTTKPLPPPTPGLLKAIDAACGASPGDEGTPIDD